MLSVPLKVRESHAKQAILLELQVMQWLIALEHGTHILKDTLETAKLSVHLIQDVAMMHC